MVDTNQIKPHMPVVCSKNGQFAKVDHVEGDSLKLAKKETPVFPLLRVVPMLQ